MDQPVWRTAENKEIPMSEMTDEHLQNAYNYAEQRTMFHHNKTMTFGTLMDNLEAAAEQRGLTLQSVDEKKQMGEFLSNRRQLKLLQKLDKQA